ncbi:MAG: hypothetical protein CM15mP109_07990 [Candidatus Dadabacteria bacterium]|nr:MAG: hypothetical protein CM15mP109_07990 [Candidatus Dadabacteria bacterium]
MNRNLKFYEELSSKSDVINNSFGFTGQITDYSRETLQNTFPKLINTFASQQETFCLVLVIIME